MNTKIINSLKISSPSRKGRLYANIFISLTLSVFITILMLSTILHKNFESIIFTQAYSNINNGLYQVNMGTDFLCSTARNLCLRIYHDWDVSKLRFYSEPSDIDINAALSQLNYYRATTPYVDSIYVYNAKSNIFYISSSKVDNAVQSDTFFYDRSIVDYLSNYKLFMPIPRIVKTNTDSRNFIFNVYSFMYYDYQLENEKPDYVVIVNISEEWINKIINGNNKEFESNIFIIDDEDRIVSETYRYPIMTGVSNEEYIKKVRQAESSQGYFIEKVQNIESFVTYMPSSSYDGWMIIQITPYKTIMDRIKELRNNTIFYGVLILILGLVFSFLISRKLYKPIDSILSRLKKLEAEKKDTFYTLKQEFLRNIVSEPQEHDLEAIQGKFADFGVKLDSKGNILIILLKIDRYNDFCDRYNAEDRNIFKFAIMNIAAEVCQKYYDVETVDMKDDSMVLLLGLKDQSRDNYMQITEEIINSIRLNVYNYIKVSLSAAVSMPGYTLECVNHLYNNVLEASLHRVLYGYGCVIFAEKINVFKSNTYVYPVNKEKALIDNLMAGKMDEVKKIYLEVIDGLKECSYMTFNFTLTRLAFSISTAIDTIQNNNFLISATDNEIIRIFFKNLETIEELNTQLFDIFDNISKKLQDRKNDSHDYIINKIINIIDNKYMDPNLSVEYFAGLFDMSAAYVSRLFKRYTLKTIIDYVSEIRMEKAKEFLLNTVFTVEKIAEKTGFTSSVYFYKSFKKINGVTPGEYRIKNRVDTNI